MISEKIASKTDKMHHNSIVTGLLKGTGIVDLFINENGTYNCKKARNFYIKSRRVYRAYNVHKNLSRVLAQIICARKVSANKLLKIKNDVVFKNFVEDLKPDGEGNYQLDSLFEEKFKIENLISTEIMNNIIDEVLLYIWNPSQKFIKRINNPLLDELN